MTEELHAAIANFRIALTDFWKDYVSGLDLSRAYGMDPAQGFFDDHKAVLTLVLGMRAHARCIEDTLASPLLKGLDKKEN